MNQIISCDWGTSSLRLRLVGMDEQEVLAQVTGPGGIAAVFEAWRQSGEGEAGRLSFYQSVLKDQVALLEEKTQSSLRDIPLVISGMASSNIGMLEMSYKELPFRADGQGLNTRLLEATDDFRHPVLLISGGKTDRDVMRGEETQLAGCILAENGGEQVFLFPGTHSKHILVEGRNAVSFKTYMTGEFFSLLSGKSILAGSVREAVQPGNNRLEDPRSPDGVLLKSFEDGVKDSIHANLLNSSFWVRTNSLFEKYTKEENYYYLSGLLIGTELKELRGSKTRALTVVGDETQKTCYLAALRQLGIAGVQFQDAAQAVIRGHCRIYKRCHPF